MTVVAAVELDDAIAAGKSTGQADCAQRGFCSRIHKADFFDRGNQFCNELGDFNFSFRRRSE